MNAEGPDIMLARQTILNCGEKLGFGAGCHGGESAEIFEFMRQVGLPDETCNNYAAESHACPLEGDDAGIGFCSNCMAFGGDVTNWKCWAVDNFVKYHIVEYGYVSGEQAIMSEVYNRGPVVCGVVCPDEFVYGYDMGVFRYKGNETDMDHDVEIVGWGEEDGVPYWKVRNSWGTYWGENGFFKVVRGRGLESMRIDESCAFAIVDSEEQRAVLDGRVGGSMFGVRPVHHGVPPHKRFPESYKEPPAPNANDKKPHVTPMPDITEEMTAALPTQSNAQAPAPVSHVPAPVPFPVLAGFMFLALLAFGLITIAGKGRKTRNSLQNRDGEYTTL